MMPPTTVFLHYLDKLDLLLEKAGHFGGGIERRRLHTEMFPLLQQARIAIGFSLRTVCPLAGREIVSFAAEEDTLAGVRKQLASTRRYLAAMPDSDFAGIASRRIATRAGFAELTLSGEEYWLQYAMPNFFFHYAMVYAIARQAGLPIGKADFDGYHHYPAAFLFPDTLASPTAE